MSWASRLCPSQDGRPRYNAVRPIFHKQQHSTASQFWVMHNVTMFNYIASFAIHLYLLSTVVAFLHITTVLAQECGQSLAQRLSEVSDAAPVVLEGNGTCYTLGSSIFELRPPRTNLVLTGGASTDATYWDANFGLARFRVAAGSTLQLANLTIQKAWLLTPPKLAQLGLIQLQGDAQLIIESVKVITLCSWLEYYDYFATGAAQGGEQAGTVEIRNYRHGALSIKSMTVTCDPTYQPPPPQASAITSAELLQALTAIAARLQPGQVNFTDHVQLQRAASYAEQQQNMPYFYKSITMSGSPARPVLDMSMVSPLLNLEEGVTADMSDLILMNLCYEVWSPGPDLLSAWRYHLASNLGFLMYNRAKRAVRLTRVTLVVTQAELELLMYWALLPSSGSAGMQGSSIVGALPMMPQYQNIEVQSCTNTSITFKSMDSPAWTWLNVTLTSQHPAVFMPGVPNYPTRDPASCSPTAMASSSTGPPAAVLVAGSNVHLDLALLLSADGAGLVAPVGGNATSLWAQLPVLVVVVGNVSLANLPSSSSVNTSQSSGGAASNGVRRRLLRSDSLQLSRSMVLTGFPKGGKDTPGSGNNIALDLTDSTAALAADDVSGNNTIEVMFCHMTLVRLARRRFRDIDGLSVPEGVAAWAGLALPIWAVGRWVLLWVLELGMSWIVGVLAD